jgi:hypothetical protein
MGNQSMEKYYHNLELVLRRSIRDRLAGTPSDASTLGTGLADCWWLGNVSEGERRRGTRSYSFDVRDQAGSQLGVIGGRDVYGA